MKTLYVLLLFSGLLVFFLYIVPLMIGGKMLPAVIYIAGLIVLAICGRPVDRQNTTGAD